MTGKQLKLKGMRQASIKHEVTLWGARLHAEYIARDGRIISIDDVYRTSGIDPKYLGNAAGSVFTGDKWEWMGYIRSTRKAAHARMIRTWRLRKP